MTMYSRAQKLHAPALENPTSTPREPEILAHDFRSGRRRPDDLLLLCTRGRHGISGERLTQNTKRFRIFCCPKGKSVYAVKRNDEQKEHDPRTGMDSLKEHTHLNTTKGVRAYSKACLKTSKNPIPRPAQADSSTPGGNAFKTYP